MIITSMQFIRKIAISLGALVTVFTIVSATCGAAADATMAAGDTTMIALDTTATASGETTNTTGATTATTHLTRTAPAAPRPTPKAYSMNYDAIGPQDDTSSTTLDEILETSHPKRMAWLLTAAKSEDFRETTASRRHNFRGLVPGDDTEADGSAKPYKSTLEIYGSDIARQPAGPLTGRIIFCSAGHGWTNDNTSTSLWYTQRPVTHGVVEDLGNLDQMNLYADICFRAGATIVPLRPIGYQHSERIIDNVSQHAAFHGTWADSVSTASFGFDGATVPYRFAAAAVKESAVARFQPVIPVTDVYPVYCWVRTGADRVTQTYRIVHGGGATEVDVDHRRVGNGWVYLGSYTFKAGNNGYVEVTNQVRDAQSVSAGGVVIADAIRFGNGMGDVNRGGGISGYPREEEASRYWVERSLAPTFPPIYNAVQNSTDQGNNVGSAPRFAAVMNRETDGNYFDRLFLSFHSNAAGGRGTIGLYNSHAALRPDHQIELAKLTADELNAEMTSAGIHLTQPWFTRPVRTDAHINFGEIRRDYLNNEMSATIVEVAFHDNAQDAALLRQLSIRQAFAQSAYRATIGYFAEVGQQDVPMYSPPNAPALLSVMEGTTSNTLDIQWTAATEDPLSSPTDKIKYRIYRSIDGILFDRGTDVGPKLQYTIKNLKPHQSTYFRVTAVSPGGESQPSGILGASIGNGPRALIVQGAPTVTNDMALTQTEPANLGAPTRSGGSFVRLIPREMNNGEQVRTIGDGLDRLHMGFDSMDMQTYLATPALQQSYATVVFTLGRNPIPPNLTTTQTLTALHDYVTSGGHLLFTGARLAEVADQSIDSVTRWNEFVSTVLQTAFAAPTSNTLIIKAGQKDLTTITLQIGNRQLHYFDPRLTQVLEPQENGHAVLAYSELKDMAAVATLKDRLLRTAIIGFPLEELAKRDEQSVLVGQILLAMGLEVQPLHKPKAEKKTEKPDDSKKDEEPDTATDEKETSTPAGSAGVSPATSAKANQTTQSQNKYKDENKTATPTPKPKNETSESNTPTPVKVTTAKTQTLTPPRSTSTSVQITTSGAPSANSPSDAVIAETNNKVKIQILD